MLSGTGGTPPADGGGTPPSGTGGTPPAAGSPAAAWWGADVPKEHADLAVAKGFDKNPGLALSSYYNANKVLSGATDIVAVPGADAPPEMHARFNKALGVPDDPSGYEYKFAPEVEGKVDQKYVDWSKKFFKDLGVPATKAQAGIDSWMKFASERSVEMANEQRAANEASVKELETKMGAEKWQQSLKQGQAAFKALGLPADVVEQVEKSIGGSALMQLMVAVGSKIPLAEGTVMGNGGANPPTDPAQMTLEQLSNARNALNADTAFNEAYYKADHPKHNDAVQQMLAINTAIVARQKAARGA